MLQAPVPSTAARWRSLVLTVGAAGALVIAIDTSLDAQAMVRSRGANLAPTLVASSVASTTPSRDAATASTSPIERCADPSGAE